MGLKTAPRLDWKLNERRRCDRRRHEEEFQLHRLKELIVSVKLASKSVVSWIQEVFSQERIMGLFPQ